MNHGHFIQYYMINHVDIVKHGPFLFFDLNNL